MNCGRVTARTSPISLHRIKRDALPVASADRMDRWIDALPWLVTALGLAIAVAAMVPGLLDCWLRYPLQDRRERE